MIRNSSWAAAKMFLAVADPIQNLVDRGGITHVFCNRQAINIMQNDGWIKEAELAGKYLVYLNRGNCWADRGWKCFAHYLKPESGNGLGPWPDAGSECEHYLAKARLCWERQKLKHSFFYLGAAAHLVQDLCVPHHARGIAFNGHQRYERWVQHHFYLFAADSAGCYDLAPPGREWTSANARVARDFMAQVGLKNSEQGYRRATKVLLPLAQRTTAGFLLQCLQDFKKPTTSFFT